jgi:shikimate kinase
MSASPTISQMPRGHIFLVGYRGSGKSTVGRHLAALLHRPLVDTDSQIQERAGRPIAEIFRLDGEEAFRNLESEAIHDIPREPDLVVALGGGAVLRETNRMHIRNMGRVVWLKTDPHQLAKRIAADANQGSVRPSLTGEDPSLEVSKVLAIREPIYRSVCDWELESTNQSPEQLAQLIADWYESTNNAITHPKH